MAALPAGSDERGNWVAVDAWRDRKIEEAGEEEIMGYENELDCEGEEEEE